MKILILNSGSSSIKFKVFEMPQRVVLCTGLIERIGSTDARISYKTLDWHETKKLAVKDHETGLKMISNLILDKSHGVVTHVSEVDAVGHRVVHGGDQFSETIIVDDSVKTQIEQYSSLAPLHNPANLKGIKLAEQIFPEAKQVAVFDTAFHSTIPKKAFTYAIPTKLSEDFGIRLYGFHGTSHKYIAQKARDYLGEISNKIITIHLGNGCSITAIKDGKSFDHSLGFAPSNGLIMGTRSGDIDHSMIFHLVNHLGYSLASVNAMLNKESGMLGLTGFSDMRDIQKGAEKGIEQCILALEMNAYRIKKYIGAYTAAMNGLDAIVFTAGIGENSSVLRSMVCAEMQYFGIEIDERKNTLKLNGVLDISAEKAKVKTLVIATNEELEIAKQVFDLVK